MSIIRNIRTPIMHRAVEANGFVFVGGTIADDTSVSMGEQTRNILGKIARYLKEAGTDTSRVVSASIFVTDLSKKKEMDAAWTEFFGDNLPTRATVGVADLGGGALIEGVVPRLKGASPRARKGAAHRWGYRLTPPRPENSACPVIFKNPTPCPQRVGWNG